MSARATSNDHDGRRAFRDRLDEVARIVREWTDLRAGIRALRFDGWCRRARALDDEHERAQPGKGFVTDPVAWKRLGQADQVAIAGYRVMCLLCLRAGLDRLPDHQDDDVATLDLKGLMAAELLFDQHPDRLFELWALVAEAIEMDESAPTSDEDFAKALARAEQLVHVKAGTAPGTLLEVRDGSFFLHPVDDSEYDARRPNSYSIALWEGCSEVVIGFGLVESPQGKLYTPSALNDDPDVHTGNAAADLWLFRARTLRSILRGGYNGVFPSYLTVNRLRAAATILWRRLRQDGVTLLQNVGGTPPSEIAALSKWLASDRPSSHDLESAMAGVIHVFPHATKAKDDAMWVSQLRSLIPQFSELSKANKQVRLVALLGESRPHAEQALGNQFAHTYCVLPSGAKKWWSIAATGTLVLPQGETLSSVFREAGRACRSRKDARKLLGWDAVADDDYWMMLLFRKAWERQPGTRIASFDDLLSFERSDTSPLPSNRLLDLIDGHRSTLEPDPFAASIAVVHSLLATVVGFVEDSRSRRPAPTHEDKKLATIWPTQAQLQAATKRVGSKKIGKTFFAELRKHAGLQPGKQGMRNRRYSPMDVKALIRAAHDLGKSNAGLIEESWAPFAKTL